MGREALLFEYHTRIYRPVWYLAIQPIIFQNVSNWIESESFTCASLNYPDLVNSTHSRFPDLPIGLHRYFIPESLHPKEHDFTCG